MSRHSTRLIVPTVTGAGQSGVGGLVASLPVVVNSKSVLANAITHFLPEKASRVLEMRPKMHLVVTYLAIVYRIFFVLFN